MFTEPPIIRTQPEAAAPVVGVLKSSDFWPAIDLAVLRDKVAVDGSVTAARLTHAASEAYGCVIDQLLPWAARQQALGHASMDAVPAISINDASVHVLRFERAVYAYCKANLAERYADADASGRARNDSGSDVRDVQASEYRRDALHAVRDILGVPRMTSELI